MFIPPPLVKGIWNVFRCLYHLALVRNIGTCSDAYITLLWLETLGRVPDVYTTFPQLEAFGTCSYAYTTLFWLQTLGRAPMFTPPSDVCTTPFSLSRDAFERFA